MAVTTAFCNQAKLDILNGVHLAAHTYKLALIRTGHSGTYSKATLAAGTPGTGAPTTSNLGTDEVAASGTYAAGGGVVNASTGCERVTATSVANPCSATGGEAVTLGAASVLFWPPIRSRPARRVPEPARVEAVNAVAVGQPARARSVARPCSAIVGAVASAELARAQSRSAGRDARGGARATGYPARAHGRANACTAMATSAAVSHIVAEQARWARHQADERAAMLLVVANARRRGTCPRPG